MVRRLCGDSVAELSNFLRKPEEFLRVWRDAGGQPSRLIAFQSVVAPAGVISRHITEKTQLPRRIADLS